MMLAFMLAFALASAQTRLEDGVYTKGSLWPGQDGSYLFHVDQAQPEKDLTVTLTTWSDFFDPNMYMSAGTAPTRDVYQWKSLNVGSGAIVIQGSYVTSNTDYYILVVCGMGCRFHITVSYTEEIVLTLGLPVLGSVLKGHEAIYRFNVVEPVPNDLVFTVTPSEPNTYFDAFVSENAPPTPDNSLEKEEVWPYGLQFQVPKVNLNSTYKVAVLGMQDLTFTVRVAETGGVKELQASRPVQGTVNSEEFNYYKINVGNANDTLIVQLTIYSGETAIYVKYDKKPTIEEYDYRNFRHTNDTIVISPEDRANKNHPTGDYYIGVYGYIQSAYTIFASLDRDSWIPLYSGVPQNGYVNHHEIDYYSMMVPPKVDLNITFHLSAIDGNPNLYVQLCTSIQHADCIFTRDMFHHPNNYPGVYYSRNKTGDDAVYIPHVGSKCLDSCKYVVAVTGRGMGRSQFILLGSYNDTEEHVLMGDVPMTRTLSREGYIYFCYSVFNETVLNVTFQLTPVTGDPDLFVSRSNSRPNVSDYDLASMNNNAMLDSVTFVRGVNNDKTLVGVYHIAVHSFDQTTFSLVAHERVPGRNTTIRLYAGQPQQDALYNLTQADQRIYMFDIHYIEESKQAISISLTRLTGNFLVYVANAMENLRWEQDIFIYNWCTCYVSNTDQAYVITIPTDDPSYLMDSTYLVLVQATEFAMDKSASYIISYSSGDGLISLQENIPFFDEVLLSQSKYYIFPIHFEHEDVNIQLTALTGDPDVYISLNDSNRNPSAENHDFKSNSFGSEVISRQWEEFKEFCPALPEDYTFGEPAGCMMYITVYGFSASVYSIKVTARKGIPSLLPLGVPAAGELTKTLYDYYYSLVQPNTAMSVHLQPLVGDADLFLNILDYKASGSDVKKWRRPNQQEKDYFSQSGVLADSIGLSPEDMQQKCLSGTCIALVGVSCFSDICRYMITTSQDELPQLVEGSPKFGQVDAGKFAYYKFYNQKDTASILITLTPLNNGDPDLFVSQGSSKRPTTTDFDWSAQTWRGENLVVSVEDPHFNATHTMRGYYVIGVRGFVNTTYSLIVTTDPDPVTQIVARVPVQAAVIAQGVKYYSYFNYKKEDISIALTPISGSALLMANAYHPAIEELYDSLPTRSNATWSSLISGHQNYLYISSTDPQFCDMCNYLIGVFGEGGNCSYSLTVSSGNESVVLQNGIPMQGSVVATEWKYYSFYLNSRSDLDISLTNYAGDADLYVSTGIRLIPSEAEWTKNTTKRVEHIRIRQADLHYKTGSYAIGILGVKNTNYSITAHARDSLITVVDGWPQTYSIMYNSQDHLKFEYLIGQDGKDIVSCKVRSLSHDFWPRVYVSFAELRNASAYDISPGPNGAEHSYSSDDYDKVYSQLTFQLGVPPATGLYVIAVYGKSTVDVMSEEVGSFELMCAGQSNSTILTSEQVVYGSLSKAQERERFEIYVNEPGLLEVTVIPCAGRVSLSVSSNYTLESDKGVDIIVSRIVDGKMEAEVPNALGKYYVTVRMLQSSEYFDRANFQLSFKIIPRGQKRTRKIVPGNDGLVTWLAVGVDDVTVSWSPPEYENGDVVPGSFYYRLYLTNSSQVKMNTICGMRLGEELGLVSVVQSLFAISGPIKVTLGETQTINLMAFSDFPQEPIPYNPTEVFLRAPRGRRRFSLLLVGVITVALLIALVGLFVLWKKYRRVRRTLENEMMDVRNVASVSSERIDFDSAPAPKKGQIYQPLELARD